LIGPDETGVGLVGAAAEGVAETAIDDFTGTDLGADLGDVSDISDALDAVSDLL